MSNFPACPYRLTFAALCTIIKYITNIPLPAYHELVIHEAKGENVMQNITDAVSKQRLSLSEEPKLYITGGRVLEGELGVQGAKNSVLPILAAAVLTDEEVVLHNCPDLTDAYGVCRILAHLGADCKRENTDIIVKAKNMISTEIPEDLMKKMRSTIVFLGPVLARSKHCRFSLPGGCTIGLRPINMHVNALEQMGAKFTLVGGFYECTAPAGGLHGANISLSMPSVGATENIMMAGVLAKGTTVIHNAAREPEITDLANFLTACGARIKGAGGSELVIEGVAKLHGAEHTIIPDRIVAATYLCCAAITRGSLVLKGADASHIGAALNVLGQIGCGVYLFGDRIGLNARRRLKSPDRVVTGPYPAFPTDAQPMFLALATNLYGTTIFHETIFENRYRHVGELVRMGAKISAPGQTAIIEGVKHLSAAALEPEDLRGGAALVTAALAAEGTSTVSNLTYIDRGYDAIENNLRLIGADITRR